MLTVLNVFHDRNTASVALNDEILTNFISYQNVTGCTIHRNNKWHYEIFLWRQIATVHFADMVQGINTAHSKPTGTANWYLKCCRGQLRSRISPGVSRQTQRAIQQMRFNRLSTTVSCQALIGQVPSPTCPHCGNGDETAEHLLLLCPKCSAERQRYFGDSIDITDVYQDYESLVEFLISSGHLSPIPPI